MRAEVYLLEFNLAHDPRRAIHLSAYELVLRLKLEQLLEVPDSLLVLQRLQVACCSSSQRNWGGGGGGV